MTYLFKYLFKADKLHKFLTSHFLHQLTAMTNWQCSSGIPYTKIHANHQNKELISIVRYANRNLQIYTTAFRIELWRAMCLSNHIYILLQTLTVQILTLSSAPQQTAAGSTLHLDNISPYNAIPWSLMY